jgi:hypothetical protein
MMGCCESDRLDKVNKFDPVHRVGENGERQEQNGGDGDGEAHPPAPPLDALTLAASACAVVVGYGAAKRGVGIGRGDVLGIAGFPVEFGEFCFEPPQVGGRDIVDFDFSE